MKGGLQGPVKGVCSAAGVSLEDEPLSGGSLCRHVTITDCCLTKTSICHSVVI